MISLKNFFRQKMAQFLMILFAGILLVSNIAIFTMSSLQYSRESARQEESFNTMVIHLVSMEDVDTAIIYMEHYHHTHNIDVAFYDPDGTLLYQSSEDINDDSLTMLYDESDNLLGSVRYDDENSYFGNEITIGLVIINSFSILIFILFLKFIYWYLNSWYQLIGKDLELIGVEEDNFNFSDLHNVSKRLIASQETERRLKEYQREYVKMLAHDIKTPLTVIKANLEGMKLDRIEYKEEVLDDMLFEVEEIERMIPEFMKENLDSTSKKQDISKIISNIIKRLTDVFQTKNIKVISKLDSYEMNVSYLDISRIAEHLIFNAFYYSGDSGEITITLDSENKQFIVKDNGIGMNAETIEKVLKGPYRSEAAKELHHKGSGIGLQIVKDIVNRLGLKLDIDSEVNKGTKVTIHLK